MLSNYLGDKPFWRVTAGLTLPIAIQNVLTSSFQLVDTLMVSQLGDVTLSAVGMAAQWGWLSNLLGFGLCSGMSVFVAQYWGVKDYKGMRRVLGMASTVTTPMTTPAARMRPRWSWGTLGSSSGTARVASAASAMVMTRRRL